MNINTYIVTSDFRVLCVRNIQQSLGYGGISADVNRVTSWDREIFPSSVKQFDSVVDAYDYAIDQSNAWTNVLEHQRITEIEYLQERGEYVSKAEKSLQQYISETQRGIAHLNSNITPIE